MIEHYSFLELGAGQEPWKKAAHSYVNRVLNLLAQCHCVLLVSEAGWFATDLFTLTYFLTLEVALEPNQFLAFLQRYPGLKTQLGGTDESRAFDPFLDLTFPLDTSASQRLWIQDEGLHYAAKCIHSSKGQYLVPHELLRLSPGSLDNLLLEGAVATSQEVDTHCRRSVLA